MGANEKAEATYHGIDEDTHLHNKIRAHMVEELPGGAEQYMTNPAVHHQVKLLCATVTLANTLMRQEGVPEETRRRVINGIVYGHPDGYEQFRESQRRVQEMMLSRPLLDPESIKGLLSP